MIPLLTPQVGEFFFLFLLDFFLFLLYIILMTKKEGFMIYDVEVTKHDNLCGFKDLKTGKRWSIWNDPYELRDFLKVYSQSHYFVSYNGDNYDNPIIETIINERDPFIKSQQIIKQRGDKSGKKIYAKVPYASIDVMNLFLPKRTPLKVLASDLGLSIVESPIDFYIDRPLTDEEKQELKYYNDSDNDVLELVFKLTLNTHIRARFDMIEYFNLEADSNIGLPMPTIMAKGLGAKKAEHPTKHWTTPKNLIVDDETREYLENETYLKVENRSFILAGVEHTMAQGGLHSTLCNIYVPWGIILDVKGYYTLIQLIYNLLSRSLGEKGYEKVWELYRDRLERAAKGIASADSLKKGILAIWGALKAKKHLLRDPSVGTLITMTGQAFIVDLLQKLEPYINLWQSNTDGIFLTPIDGLKDGPDMENIKKAVDEWKERTGFELSYDTFENLWQKDVSNYVCLVNGKIKAKGPYVNLWNSDTTEFWIQNIGKYNQQGGVIDKAVVHYFMNGVPVEETINNETSLNMFQFTSWAVGENYQENTLLRITLKDGTVKYSKLNNKVNRIFARKIKPNDDIVMFEIVKVKPIDFTNKSQKAIDNILNNAKDIYEDGIGELLFNTGIDTDERIANRPSNVLFYNESLDTPQAHKIIWGELDKDYYINVAYKRIEDYLGIGKKNKESEGLV